MTELGSVLQNSDPYILGFGIVGSKGTKFSVQLQLSVCPHTKSKGLTLCIGTTTKNIIIIWTKKNILFLFTYLLQKWHDSLWFANDFAIYFTKIKVAHTNNNY
jgi:hypothetical protein